MLGRIAVLAASIALASCAGLEPVGRNSGRDPTPPPAPSASRQTPATACCCATAAAASRCANTCARADHPATSRAARDNTGANRRANTCTANRAQRCRARRHRADARAATHHERRRG